MMRLAIIPLLALLAVIGMVAVNDTAQAQYRTTPDFWVYIPYGQDMLETQSWSTLGVNSGDWIAPQETTVTLEFVDGEGEWFEMREGAELPTLTIRKKAPYSGPATFEVRPIYDEAIILGKKIELKATFTYTDVQRNVVTHTATDEVYITEVSTPTAVVTTNDDTIQFGQFEKLIWDDSSDPTGLSITATAETDETGIKLHEDKGEWYLSLTDAAVHEEYYTASLAVTNRAGFTSAPATVTVQALVRPTAEITYVTEWPAHETSPVRLNADESVNLHDQPLSYQWEQVSGGAITNVEYWNRRQFDFDLPSYSTVAANNTVVIRLTVTDQYNQSHSDEVKIAVIDVPDNTAPKVNLGPDRTVRAGDTVRINATVSDGESPLEELEYFWFVTEGDAAFDDSTLNISFIAPDDEPVIEIMLSVWDRGTLIDGEWLEGTDTIRITVQPPQAVAAPPTPVPPTPVPPTRVPATPAPTRSPAQGGGLPDLGGDEVLWKLVGPGEITFPNGDGMYLPDGGIVIVLAP